MSKNISTFTVLRRSGRMCDVEIALMRGALDGAVEVEFLGRALARELPQPP